jgi:hypothetical protein
MPTSNADGGRRPALDCRKHPPAECSSSPGTFRHERDPLDGFGGAIRIQVIDRASLGEWTERCRPGGMVGRVALVAQVPGTVPPRYFWPTRPRASARRVQHRPCGGSEREQTHYIPQGSRSTLCMLVTNYTGETAFGAAAEFWFLPRRRVEAPGPGGSPSGNRQVADYGRLRGVSIQPKK